MVTPMLRAGLVVVALFLWGGCATREDWKAWTTHSSHFASGTHGWFSMRNNKDGSNPKVSRTELEHSRQQDWWGLYAINVSPSQVFQN